MKGNSMWTWMTWRALATILREIAATLRACSKTQKFICLSVCTLSRLWNLPITARWRNYLTNSRCHMSRCAATRMVWSTTQTWSCKLNAISTAGRREPQWSCLAWSTKSHCLLTRLVRASTRRCCQMLDNSRIKTELMRCFKCMTLISLMLMRLRKEIVQILLKKLRKIKMDKILRIKLTKSRRSQEL